MTEKLEGKEGLVTVEATVIKSKKKVWGDRKEHTIQIRPFVTDTATVSVKTGLTIPIGGPGSYASGRVDVFFSMPCYVEEMLEVYSDLRELTDKIMDREAKRMAEEGLGKVNERG